MNKTTREIQIRISAGQLRYIYNDALLSLNALGDAKIQRASHVEPTGSEWFVDLSPIGGPLLGPFQIRESALQAEVAWIHKHKIPVVNC